MRSRLVALILIPTVVGVLLAGIQLADAIGTSAEYRRLTQVAELVQKVGALNHELAKERTLTAWSVATGNRAGRTVQLKTQRQATDKVKAQVLTAAQAIDESHTNRVREGVAEMRRWLDGLDSLRTSMVGNVPPQAAITTYSTMIGIFSSIQAGLADGVNDDRLQRDIAALGSLQAMKEEVSRQQIILIVALAERELDGEALTEFLGSWNKQQAEQASFEAEAAADDLKAYQQGVRGQQIDRADAMRQRALAQVREYNRLRDLDITTQRDLNNWYDSTTLTANAMRKVEDGLATKIVTTTRDLSDSEQRAAIVSGAMILVLLLLVLIITTRVAGSLVRPLRRLRAEALQVATTRLPETVRVLRESGEGAQVPEVPSIGINTRDEIGEVARAFDEVHREAIRLAGDEAKLRANVNSMFVNLSRRSQTLVERQLQLIEGLEQGEEDEQRLANLFRLDHLATRMRRNSENLLVLAGQEAARKWSEPVPLVDIARASLSEVENYERVQIQIPSGTLIVGPAVTDAVHLLAELIENAISFSPRESKVTVTSTPAEGGVLVTINDLGIGMSQEELGEANWRLANPPVVDVSVSRRMGLFVVGRLALRHGIRVQLSQRETGGLSALVMMPDMLISNGAGPQQGGQYEAFTSFDPSTFNQSSANGAGPHTADPINTEWPSIGGGTGNWPSFGEQPASGEQPAFGGQPASFGEQPSFGGAPGHGEQQQPSFGDRPAYGEQQPAAFGGDRPAPFGQPGFDQPGFDRQGFDQPGFDQQGFDQPGFDRQGFDQPGFDQPPATHGGRGVDEQRWPSFAEEPPAQRQDEQRWFGEDTGRWPSFAEEPPAAQQPPAQPPAQPAQPFAENRWPSFAEQPPPLQDDEPRWPSFATEPPKDPSEDSSRWSSFADPLPRRGLFESLDRARPQFGPDYASPFAEEPKPADPFGQSQNGHSGFGAFSAGNYASQDMTGPLPAVRNSPLEEQGEEFLPIFSSVGSDWFRRPEPEPAPAHAEQAEEEPEITAVHPAIPADATAPPPPLPQQAPKPPAAAPSPLTSSGLPQRRPGASGAGATWSSPADSGFQAAQAAANPQQSGTTPSGLPRRVPKANLVPGTASLAEPMPTSPAPQISPERLRSRLSSFQQGVRQGRAFTRGEENEEDK
ncbi:nitrate- and nitrite sensing domain-containing protein [Actinomadura sp. ATCC 31491]|uniref:histidine kinase n=1 Tax=Actinomadura luzonensis TaxID=2805427 RepID=A0ABT0GAC7_9ACTN|nr:nitrate- and nitrite sensing domain-containing protein [Actinomadura luzonensis]MCK2221562.1 nitrate- and nitrite sensing domain-containing protein [Actinomadura luzonensis]